MTNKKVLAIYTFLFLVPYLVCLALIGTSYNSLVSHSSSLWRTFVGGIIGALFLMATKVVIQRSVQIVEYKSNHKSARKLIGSFDIGKSPFNLYFNFFTDFVFSIASTYIIRLIFTKDIYMGNLIGYLVTILVISLLIGSNVGFDILKAK